MVFPALAPLLTILPRAEDALGLDVEEDVPVEAETLDTSSLRVSSPECSFV